MWVKKRTEEQPMSTLLQISEDMLALNNLIDEATSEDGEIDPAVQEELDRWFTTLLKDRDNKLDNYGALVRTLELRAAARMAEMERLAKRVAVDTNQAKYLKQRLREFLDMHKMPKVETRRFKFNCQNNGGVLPMQLPDDATTLPEEYQAVVIKADTDKIRADLAAGKDVPGCSLGTRGRHLRIS